MAVSCGYQNQGVTGTAHNALIELPLSLIRTFTASHFACLLSYRRLRIHTESADHNLTEQDVRSRAEAHCANTAGGEFHPAPRTCQISLTATV